MNVLEYIGINDTGLKAKYEKVKACIIRNDFYTPQLKKLQPTGYYAARLDDTNRLLLKVVRYNGQAYALCLEIIRNHDYANSRFLRGAKVVEENILDFSQVMDDKDSKLLEEIKYINQKSSNFHFLNKVISFDDEQEAIYYERLPFIIIGSAGSGKTALALECMKNLQGNVLYVSLSNFLVKNARNVYFSACYENDDQEVEFLSFNEFLESIRIPGKMIDFPGFKAWCLRNRVKDIDRIYEEFRGTLTGANIDAPFLSKETYFNLGIKQSLFTMSERQEVYSLFIRYLDFLKDNNLHDVNITSYEYLKLVKPIYDHLVVDEVQDLTNIQIKLLLSAVKSNSFILCGDANQVVHPNFFSWAKIKSFLYHEDIQKSNMLCFLVNNYRNSESVVAISNDVLKIKQQQFGSIDKESNYLIKSLTGMSGNIVRIAYNKRDLSEVNTKSRRSTKYAIVVLSEEIKALARQSFDSPLVFTVQEAKGLEYDNIILFNLTSAARDKFQSIANGINKSDLKKDLIYSRGKDKSDKSLEAYKFYINSFYVAITRAVKNLYILEEYDNDFLDLLDLKQYEQEVVSATEAESSLEEWQKEANNLEQQGKLEQANTIREQILKEQQVSWEILTREKFETLFRQINTLPKDEKIHFLEYCIIYKKYALVSMLEKQGMKAASNISKALGIIKEKYFSEYRRLERMVISTQKYGLEFRNQFNQTPVMVACKIANAELLAYLIEQGAEIDLLNNEGLTPLQEFIDDISAFNTSYAMNSNNPEKITTIYRLLSQNDVTLKIGDQLFKLSPNSMEFFLYNQLVALAIHLANRNGTDYIYAFKATFLASKLQSVHDNILPSNRKRREYISYILSKNEANRMGDYNKKLFLRVAYGRYILNPAIEVRQSANWCSLYKLLKLKEKEQLEESIAA